MFCFPCNHHAGAYVYVLTRMLVISPQLFFSASYLAYQNFFYTESKAIKSDRLDRVLPHAINMQSHI